MNLIDRYVTEVGKRLPLLKGRKDIEQELRSTLEDMLEDRARKADRPADEALAIELLREYGSPDKVAATYNNMPYLIGPRVFPFYLMVLKIVLSVVGTVLLVLTGIEIAVNSPMNAAELFSALGQGLSGLFGAFVSAFGSMTLVFAILERVLPAEEFKTSDDKEWDPAELAREPEPDDVKPWEPILSIIFTAVVLSIFNFNPGWIGIYHQVDGNWTVLPVLSEAFFRWLPFINIAWVAEIILNAILLTTGRWQISTRLFSIGIKVFEIIIGYFLLTGPFILSLTPESLQATGIFDAEAAHILGTLARQGVQGLIALIMFLEALDVVQTLAKILKQRRLATA